MTPRRRAVHSSAGPRADEERDVMTEARVIPLRVDDRRRTWGDTDDVPPGTEPEDAGPPPWEEALAESLAFLRRRLEGDYAVDEFGFDADLTEHVILPALRPLYRSWF